MRVDTVLARHHLCIIFFAPAMAIVFATRDGWETIATMCVRKDFTANIAWNSVRVHRRNSYVMQPVDAFAVWDMMVSIA